MRQLNLSEVQKSRGDIAHRNNPHLLKSLISLSGHMAMWMWKIAVLCSWPLKPRDGVALQSLSCHCGLSNPCRGSNLPGHGVRLGAMLVTLDLPFLDSAPDPSNLVSMSICGSSAVIESETWGIRISKRRQDLPLNGCQSLGKDVELKETGTGYQHGKFPRRVAHVMRNHDRRK